MHRFVCIDRQSRALTHGLNRRKLGKLVCTHVYTRAVTELTVYTAKVAAYR